MSFRLSRPGSAQVRIHDLTGRRIKSLVDAMLPAGDHDTEWNGRDESGREVAAGTYLLRLTVEDSVEAERLVVVR